MTKMRRKEERNRNSAITLVSLVVTIVILLILAGISLNLTIGQNGIIERAMQAKKEINEKAIEEQEALKSLYNEILANTDGEPYYPGKRLEDYKRKIAQAITNEKVETAYDAATEIMVENIGKILQARTEDATATKEYIAKGKTAYINGEKVVGTGEKYDVIDLKGRFYLYKPDMYNSESNRWEKIYNYGTSSIEYTEEYLSLKTSGTTDFTISELIDFSDYQVLYYEFEVDTMNNTFFGITVTKPLSNPMSRTDYGLTCSLVNVKNQVYQLKNGHYLARIDVTNLKNGYVTLEGNGNTIKVYSVYLR